MTANPHILIIDDDQLVRDFAVHTIEYGTNRKVTTFDSGFHAWQYIQSQPQKAEIIIADANIPDMDGLELLGQVKKAYPETIFILTASNPMVEKTARRLGADAFLSKPFSESDLFAIVKQFAFKGAAPGPEKPKTYPMNIESLRAPDDVS